MCKYITTTVPALTSQGATQSTVSTAVNSITNGMGEVAGSTTKSMMKIEGATLVATDAAVFFVRKHLEKIEY